MNLTLKKVTLESMELELSRVTESITETDSFLKKIKSLTPGRLKQIKELMEDLELVKQIKKTGSKEKHLQFLKDSEKNFKKAIKHMKKNKQKIYNPIKGTDWME